MHIFSIRLKPSQVWGSAGTPHVLKRSFISLFSFHSFAVPHLRSQSLLEPCVPSRHEEEPHRGWTPHSVRNKPECVSPIATNDGWKCCRHGLQLQSVGGVKRYTYITHLLHISFYTPWLKSVLFVGPLTWLRFCIESQQGRSLTITQTKKADIRATQQNVSILSRVTGAQVVE